MPRSLNEPGLGPHVSSSVVAARVFRGATVESVHRASAAVVDADGHLVAHAGDPDLVAFTRSSIKAYQLAPLVASGAADRFGFSEAELALMCSSHSGEPAHVNGVLAILERIGLKEDALQCGVDMPFDKRIAGGVKGPPRSVYNNCSGKHANMLAQCVAMSAPAATYLDYEHPVQRSIRELLGRAAGVPPAKIPHGVDGCSAPNYALALSLAARLFATLARPARLGVPYSDALERIRTAMVSHPEMVAGSDRFDTRLMRAGRGRLAGKIGGEAVFGVADAETGLGLFLKIEDGNMRAVPAVTVASCKELGWLSSDAEAELDQDLRPPVHNVRGLVVGHIEPVAPLLNRHPLPATPTRGPSPRAR